MRLFEWFSIKSQEFMHKIDNTISFSTYSQIICVRNAQTLAWWQLLIMWVTEFLVSVFFFFFLSLFVMGLERIFHVMCNNFSHRGVCFCGLPFWNKLVIFFLNIFMAWLKELQWMAWLKELQWMKRLLFKPSISIQSQSNI